MDHGHFHWNELMTRDAEGARAFYSDVIGWTFDTMTMPDGGAYLIAKDGDKPLGGIFDISGSDFDGQPVRWFAYLAVDDVDKRLEKAVAAGAEILRPPFDVPGVGRIAQIRQPDGAEIGWMTPAN
jgi:predicted enzyme related to lactoylglutathione lyase